MDKLTIEEMSYKLKSNPLMLHINPIGLFRLASDNPQRFSKFNLILNKVKNSGGNIAIPDYSVSFVQLKEDIRREGLIKIWELEEYNLKIEALKFFLNNLVQKKLVKKI